ncbi:hypothetical protein ACTI_58550 [Actinoplanes sp. OR16]|uniref:hypothetical protein n=1 Tax=Actinoplanes sp. OR16 TaxID=946334 RepID=UPI000F6CB1D9|nr:hypothetical protein [Actinoplanes sp. OR16]BBH69170.1 hypothetical protein ACTI_58550 [Actinoplanes sp. OR16]
MKFIQLITDDAPACAGGACGAPASLDEPLSRDSPEDQEPALVGAQDEVDAED